MAAPLLDRVASACRDVGAADPGVTAFYLFGSHAAGDARPDSDVDLGVLRRAGDLAPYERERRRVLLGEEG